MVSVVILAYNRVAEVEITLDKLKSYAASLPFAVEIIVVDNESADHTTAMVQDKFPDVRIVTIQKNVGISGWNEGFKIAKYKYLLVLDDDSHIESGLPEAVAYLEQNDRVGILALNITSGPYLTDTWIWQDGRPWQHEQDLPGFFGCGAIIRKEVYEKVGGFAEWVYVYAHEWEYGIRCLNAGYAIKYFQKSSVIHRASKINRTAKRARMFGTRNEMAIVYKYFDDKRWTYILRMFVNNLKRMKNEGVLNGWYDVVGAVKFMAFRSTLAHTPVTKEVQQFFIENYKNTFPVFRILKKLKRKTGS